MIMPVSRKTMKRYRYTILLFVPLIFSSCSLPQRLAAAIQAFAAEPATSTPVYAGIAGAECIPDSSQVEIARVVRVIDGDSIEVLLDGEEVQVRYIGIDTPEYYSDDRPEAITATQANREMVEGATVYLFKDQSNTDVYDRLLRYVLTDEVFVNLELVSGGYAAPKEYPPDTACHALFQQAIQ